MDLLIGFSEIIRIKVITTVFTNSSLFTFTYTTYSHSHHSSVQYSICYISKRYRKHLPIYRYNYQKVCLV